MFNPTRLFNNLGIHPVSQASGDTDTEDLPSNMVAAQDTATLDTAAPEAERRSLTDFGDLTKQSLNSDVLLNICKKLPLPDLKAVKLTGLEGRNLADLVLLEKPVSLGVNYHNLEAIKSGAHPYKGPISLDFSGCLSITDEDLALIVQNNPNITKLNLSLCHNLKDAGLQHLAGCKNLQSLNLSGCYITDAGLQHLARCKNLQSLNLIGCNITDAGREQLLQHLPHLIIPQLQLLGVTELNMLMDEFLDVTGLNMIMDVGLGYLRRLATFNTDRVG